MKRTVRRRFWIEVALSFASATFLFLTLLWKDWIEIVFHVDPDNHSGSLEWLIVLVSAAITLAFFWAARIEWRRAESAIPQVN